MVSTGPAGKTKSASANTLFQQGAAAAKADNLPKAFAWLEQCLQREPDHLDALGLLGTLLQKANQLEDAEGMFRRVLAIAPEHPQGLACLANILVLRGKSAEATQLYELILARGQGNLNIVATLARCYMEQARWQDAKACCEQMLSVLPYDAGALSMAEFARFELGDADGAPRETNVAAFQIRPPPQYPSTRAFNDALVEQLLAHPDLVEDPHDYAIRGGHQTGDISDKATEAIGHLSVAIDAGVGHYLKTRSEAGTPDFYLDRPVSTWKMALWGTAMRGGAYLDPHIHRTAWLSGVYYARVPDTIRRDSTNGAGWIEFGGPPTRYPCQRTHPTHRLCPEEGMVLVFPSYVTHRTIPVDGDELRVSFAFDLSV